MQTLEARRRSRARPVIPPPAPSGEVFAPVELRPSIRAHLRPVEYDKTRGPSPLAGRVNVVKNWEKWSMARRLAFLRELVEDTSRDPAIVDKAHRILQEAGAPVRDHQAQWAALLKWVQRNIYYSNEPDERLQSPQYTLSRAHGDCDDFAILLAALGQSMRLPWRFVISGRNRKGEKVRWIEGDGPTPTGVSWGHIYVVVGWPPFQPTTWRFAEPTLDVPLGWDVMARDPRADRRLPELGALGADDAPRSTLFKTRDFVVNKIEWPKVATTVVGGVLAAYAIDRLLKRRRR